MTMGCTRPDWGRIFLLSPSIVNQDGVVYEKDLGTDTGKIAAAMTEYNPGDSWRAVE